MQSVQLTDKVYRKAKKNAKQAGFDSVEAYFADVVTFDMFEQTDRLNHLFTPERIALAEKAVQRVKSGDYLTSEQVKSHFEKRFKT